MLRQLLPLCYSLQAFLDYLPLSRSYPCWLLLLPMISRLARTSNTDMVVLMGRMIVPRHGSVWAMPGIGIYARAQVSTAYCEEFPACVAPSNNAPAPNGILQPVAAKVLLHILWGALLLVLVLKLVVVRCGARDLSCLPRGG